MRFSQLLIVAGIVVGLALNILFGGFLILAGIGLAFIERAQPPAAPGTFAPMTPEEVAGHRRKTRTILLWVGALTLAVLVYYLYHERIIFP